MSEPYRVTFVCSGNICRSPMGEWILRRHIEEAGLAGQVEVDSSGTNGYHIGDPADRRTVRTLEKYGYGSDHSARRFQAEWFPRYDLVLALDSGHVRELRALAPDDAARDKIRLVRSFDPAADGRDVPDPYYGDMADFELVHDQLEAAVPGLVEAIRAELKER